MSDFKIVFAGPPGAGKTTAIAALSDAPPVATEVQNTDAGIAKERTTVGLDFGSIDLGDGRAVRLFGTPGQLRFKFMWRAIAAEALGLVILIDHSRPDPLGDLVVYLDAFRELLPKTNCVVGVGRVSRNLPSSIDAYGDLLAARGLLLPVLPIDARNREDVSMLVDIVLAQAETRFLDT